MDDNWIVAANAGRARFFALPKLNEPMQEVFDMVNTSARLRDNEIDTDSLGQHAASGSRHGAGMAGTTSNDYQPHQTPRQHEAELFARDVATYLLKACHEGRFRRLSLVASPEFLGVLRKQLDRQVAAKIAAEINKDYTQATGEELRERVRAHEAKH
jgi:protein required for attachment to host cells